MKSLFAAVVVCVLASPCATSAIDFSVCVYSDMVELVKDGHYCHRNASLRAGSHHVRGVRKDGMSVKLKWLHTSFQTPGRDAVRNANDGSQCVRIPNPITEFTRFDLVCAMRDSQRKPLLSWVLVSCGERSVASDSCLGGAFPPSLLGTLCNTSQSVNSSHCLDVTVNASILTCFNRFTATTCPVYGLHVTSIVDIIAYISVAVILLTWIVAICIPNDKCKPVYNSDSILRVPRQLYEMYGVPAKRKLSFRRLSRSKKKESVVPMTIPINKQALLNQGVQTVPMSNDNTCLTKGGVGAEAHRAESTSLRAKTKAGVAVRLDAVTESDTTTLCVETEAHSPALCVENDTGTTTLCVVRDAGTTELGSAIHSAGICGSNKPIQQRQTADIGIDSSASGSIDKTKSEYHSGVGDSKPGPTFHPSHSDRIKDIGAYLEPIVRARRHDRSGVTDLESGIRVRSMNENIDTAPQEDHNVFDVHDLTALIQNGRRFSIC